ncbi:uncharacterized protein LOC144101521 [Amblyomma americanum]
MPLRFYAFVFLWIFMVMITGVHGSAKTPSDFGYKKEIMLKVLRSLFPKKGVPKLPDHYVAFHNPFNKSGTLFRFNITNGLMFMRGTRAVKPMEVCKFMLAPMPHAYCRLPIPGSFATYKCKLSYGRAVTDEFKINLSMQEYEGWNNPADVSGYFDVIDYPKHPRLTLTSVFVTEFSVDTTSSPPFENFTVFKKFNLSRTLLITKIWDNFTEYVFRKCKQDIRNVTKLVYTRRMNHVAHAVGEFDIIKLLQ